MSEKRYLYAVAGGGFVLGDNIHSTVPSGVYEKFKTTFNVDGSPVDAVGFLHISREGLDKQPIPVTDYLKNEAGDAYESLAELEKAIVGFCEKNVGIPNGEEDAVLSNTVDLAHPGFIRPLLLEGTIKYVTVNGETRTDAFDKKETSQVRVKRIWLDGTTADMGIVVYY